jgi:hypothetical protein
MIEHRWGDRVPADIPVQLVGIERAFGTGRLKDFSVSGALVETDFSQPMLTNVTLMILDSRRGPPHARAIPGYVVRHCEGAIGVAWWNLAPVTVTHLLAISETVTPAQARAAR